MSGVASRLFPTSSRCRLVSIRQECRCASEEAAGLRQRHKSYRELFARWLVSIGAWPFTCASYGVRQVCILAKRWLLLFAASVVFCGSVFASGPKDAKAFSVAVTIIDETNKPVPAGLSTFVRSQPNARPTLAESQNRNPIS